MKLFIWTCSAIVFAASMACGEIPAEVGAAAHQLSFLAAVAQRCDMALARGKAGLRSEACLEFERRFDPIIARIQQADEAVFAWAKGVDRSTSQVSKIEAQIFFADWQRDWRTISRTIDHLQFVRE